MGNGQSFFASDPYCHDFQEAITPVFFSPTVIDLFARKLLAENCLQYPLSAKVYLHLARRA